MCSNIVFPKSYLENRQKVQIRDNSNNSNNNSPEEFASVDYIGDREFNNVAKREKDGF